MQSIADKLIAQGRKQGWDLGRQEGIDLGRQEGKFEAVVELTIDDLELRFASVSEQLKERIRETGALEGIKALRRKLLDARTLEECERIVGGMERH